MDQAIRVLMVDDEKRFRETVAKQMGKRGYDVTIAESGEEALSILKKKPADVAVLDIKMKTMDGITALKEVKKAMPEIQVILLTGHGAVDSAKEAAELGAYDYLTKPCDIDLLLSRIHDAYQDRFRKHPGSGEKKAGDIMIRIDDYTTVTEDQTVAHAIAALKESFEGMTASSQVMETGHRSVLVFNHQGELTGILSIHDLLKHIRPAYLNAPKPTTADSIEFSPLFWQGMFLQQARALSARTVREVMNLSPPKVDVSTNLMELADLMYSRSIRRVIITEKDAVVGVVREQELFFEIASIIL